MYRKFVPVVLIFWVFGSGITLAMGRVRTELPTAMTVTNSVGMKFVRIEPGTFEMGRLNPAEGLDAGYTYVVDGGDWDEKPAHKVTITYPFYIQETEVTAEQYKQFDAAYSGSGPYATGVTWHEARAFAWWLSKKDRRNYRLPTEAEWEYACRAGTTTLFWSGSERPVEGSANPWGVKNMHNGPAEWVYDWHGSYLAGELVDPVGPESGMIKVLRGGKDAYNARSASRLAMPPDSGVRSGFDFGFRLVMGTMPRTEPLHVVPFPQECVKQTTKPAKLGPNPDRPYFNRRFALPIPPENDQDDAGPIAGVHPAVLAHCHSPGFAALDNGDLLAVYFSSSTATTESQPNTTFVQARLRHGSLQWDMPDLFVDFANMNDQSGLLWNEDGTLRFFGGGRGWPEEVPFKWAVSTDHGATWSQITLPIIEGEVGSLTPQPITSAFRDPQGNMYFAMDGGGTRSFLWRSSDEGKTWVDMGGRTEGRHSAIVPIKDSNGTYSGTLLCLGTKKGRIGDNWMQQNISRDWGRTWEPKTQSPFPYLSSNQRGHLSRLANGKLVFVSDHQARNNQQPVGYNKRGCFAAISDDDGQSWHVKTIPDTLPHESKSINGRRDWTSAAHSDGTVGYVTVAQTPNGVIHVLTTMNHPGLHFEFNETWIYSDAGGGLPRDPGYSGTVNTYREKYRSGRPKAEWSAKVCDDGRYLLHGKETWYYENGGQQYEVSYNNGRKVGLEKYWTPDGVLRWRWVHDIDGTSEWTHFWPNGNYRIESAWCQDYKVAHGRVMHRDFDNRVTLRAGFVDGIYIPPQN